MNNQPKLEVSSRSDGRAVPSLASLIFACVAFASTAFASSLPTVVPQQWREEVHADQVENIGQRQNQALDIDETFIRAFYEFHVPLAQTSVFQSRLSREEAERFLITKDGTTFVRFLVPDISYVNSFKQFREQFGEPVKKWAGAKIQGKATFHVWEPDQPDLPPIRLKVERDWPTGDGSVGRINHWASARSAVNNNEMIEELLQDRPLKLGEIYREPFAAAIKGLPFTYTYVVRRLPQDALMRGRRLAFLPLHGLLGSTHLLELAAKQNKSAQIWLRDEYIPKLARFVAEMNFNYGIWLEAHTQNMSVLADRSNGKIIKFYAKDLADVMMSPFNQALQGRLPDYGAGKEDRPAARLNEHWIDNNASPSDRFAGHFNYDYLFQSVVDMTNNPVIRRKHTAIFLKEYLKAAGFSENDLSQASRTQLAKLANGEDPEATVTNRERIGKKKSVPTDYSASFILITQEITDLAAELKFTRALETVDRQAVDALDQRWLMNVLQEKMDQGKFNWATSDSEKEYKSVFNFLRLGYEAAPVRNGVFLYKKSSGRPIGVAYGFNASEKAVINEWAGKIRWGHVFQCQSVF